MIVAISSLRAVDSSSCVCDTRGSSCPVKPNAVPVFQASFPAAGKSSYRILGGASGRHEVGSIQEEACFCNAQVVSVSMMTSSNGNIFRVTGPLCGEFTGPGEFPTQRPVTRSFDFFFDLRLNKRLSKQPWGWWCETLSWSLWRHCNEYKGRLSRYIISIVKLIRWWGRLIFDMGIIILVRQHHYCDDCGRKNEQIES